MKLYCFSYSLIDDSGPLICGQAARYLQKFFVRDDDDGDDDDDDERVDYWLLADNGTHPPVLCRLCLARGAKSLTNGPTDQRLLLVLTHPFCVDCV